MFTVSYYECSKFHWRLTSESRSIAQILCECALHFSSWRQIWLLNRVKVHATKEWIFCSQLNDHDTSQRHDRPTSQIFTISLWMYTLHIDVNAVVWQEFCRKTGPDKMAFLCSLSCDQRVMHLIRAGRPSWERQTHPHSYAKVKITYHCGQLRS